MRLKNKVAFITGGAGDIAIATAKKFIPEGASIVLFDIDESLMKERSGNLSAGNNLLTVAGDVTKLEDLERAVELGEQRFGRIDILVSCAGVLKHMPIDELSLESWNRVIGINLTGTYLTCKAVVPKMKKQKYGRIVTISSLGGRTGRPGVGIDYAASKAGVIGITQTLARELGSYNITVNSIAPGPLDGRMNNSVAPEKRAVLLGNACISRFGQPADIGDAAVFLASDEAGWITGVVLDVNGGIFI